MARYPQDDYSQKGDTTPTPSENKEDVAQKEALDHEIIGSNNVTREEAMHHGVLTHEELEVQKKLLRKIGTTPSGVVPYKPSANCARRPFDLLIMPLVMLVYLINYIDRKNDAAARLQGLERDLNLTGEQYQVGLSILFVGYLLMQVPSNALLNFSGRPSWYIGFWVIVWGLVSTLTSHVSNYGEIVACRFILGLVEAPFFCGVLFYLSKRYTKSELAFRMAIFYSASLLSGAFGNLIAAGILDGLAGARGLAAWQWLYIIEGVRHHWPKTPFFKLTESNQSITMFIGIVILFVLPDFPDTWKILSPEMKFVANRRMAIDAAEADVDEAGGMSQLRGIKLALTDPKTYLLSFMYHMITAATGFQNFFPSLTETLGYGNTNSLLLVAPPYIFMVFWSLGHSLASDKYGIRYFSLFLLNFAFTMNNTIYAWIASSIPRPPAKRAAAMAFMNSVGNAASVWTPFTYTYSSAPYYRPALGIVIGLMSMAGIAGTILRFYLERQNKRFERLENSDTQLTARDLQRLEKTAEMEGIDVATARQLQKGFRYVL
ncbi:hypothetical protein LTR37_017681 [Vermiconidia calcicola]|uniref:Uncharacterized protein n=1 Tax=Vermiconidia calcicola TaxID=1690605 RepID=A0ACC3MJI4_9PEZI|nr:hypothetical protein LTR37_017681 [Vermiconidia calcicola]